jgi:hypothetical protein
MSKQLWWLESLYRAQMAFAPLWKDIGCYSEIWLEKDALAGVVFPVTARYDVPLMVARGYASLSFLYSAAARRNTSMISMFRRTFTTWAIAIHLGSTLPRRSRRPCAS